MASDSLFFSTTNFANLILDPENVTVFEQLVTRSNELALLYYTVDQPLEIGYSSIRINLSEEDTPTGPFQISDDIPF